MKHLVRILLCLGMAACAPGVRIQSTRQLPPLAAQETFLVIKEGDNPSVQGEELGDIHIKDTGFTLVCDYDKVEALAVSKAKSLGANVLWIYEHKVPGMTSTCHQIRARAMRVADVTPYEREILWAPTRRLRQADFKANTKNRPFQAATRSNMRYRYEGRPFGPVKLTVETYFDCLESYFKESPDGAFTLAHEQLHFDITEIYARRLAKELQEQVTSISELQRKQEAIVRQVSSDCQILQDQYDTEVYADHTRQAQWQQRIEQDLTSLQPYATKSFEINRQ